MAIFFLPIGIEIKHEWQQGALSTPQARVLPFGAALGGMAVPALIYTAVNWGQAANLAGWAIPSATDIAFALGLLLGKPIGILLSTWAASKLGGGLPDGLKLADYLPAACFCGVGFTMALFIGTLAFDVGSLAANAAKLGMLMGTLMALVLGTVVARWRG